MDVENLSSDVEEFTCNVYRIESTLIDAGKGPSLRKKISEIENVDHLLITHSHHDHIENLETVIEEHRPEIYCFNKERLDIEYEDIHEIENREIFGLNEFNIKAFHTPGHIDDHLCYYFINEKILFTGDLIFSGGAFGRTDLGEGDRDKLIKSIKDVYRNTRPKEFYPGHGEPTLENCQASIENSLEEASKRESKY